MSKFAINPNAPPVLSDNEDEWLDRDRAALGILEEQAAPLVTDRPGMTPLGPLMVTPDPRYRHGEIDVVEARLAVAKSARDEAAALHLPPTQRKATDHPLIGTLISTLPAPGAAWPVAEREIWLKAAASIFDMAYKAESDDVAPEAS